MLKVADPIRLHPGSVDIDRELYKLAHNLNALTYHKAVVGQEVVDLDYKIANRSAELAELYTEEELARIGTVRSDKFKLIKYKLASLHAEAEKTRLKYKYYCDLWETYREWVNIYKKTRSLGNE